MQLESNPIDGDLQFLQIREKFEEARSLVGVLLNIVAFDVILVQIQFNLRQYQQVGNCSYRPIVSVRLPYYGSPFWLGQLLGMLPETCRSQASASTPSRWNWIWRGVRKVRMTGTSHQLNAHTTHLMSPEGPSIIGSLTTSYATILCGVRGKWGGLDWLWV